MSVIKDLKTYFPDGFTIRDAQRTILDQINDAYKSNKRFIIICAPTGTGKSLVAKALSNSTNEASPEYKDYINTYKAFQLECDGIFTYASEMNQLPSFGAAVLTITKGLQNQYHTMFTDMEILKGKSNYQCKVDEEVDTEVAPCLFTPKLAKECQGKNLCPYFNQRNATLCSKHAVFNYSMYLALPEHLRRRSVIICDEASELEDELVKRFSASIQYKALDLLRIEYEPLISEQNDTIRAWLIGILAKCVDMEEHLLSLNKNKYVKDSEKNKIRLVKTLIRQLSTVEKNWIDCEYVIEKDIKQVTFVPLRVNKVSNQLFDYGDKVVLMSATIIDHKGFAKSLGIDDYQYIEVPSAFDSKKSPINVSNKYWLNFKNLKANLPKICQDIESLLSYHKNEKGIIHTHSMEITDAIKTHLRRSVHRNRLLFREEGINNEYLLKQHQQAPWPTVLISPSLSYGIDLKDDLSRFQIIVKLPFAPLNTKRVKRLFEEDKEWYVDKMLGNFVQACGRSTRSVDDHSITYVLDANLIRVLEQNSNKLPKHFLERFQ